MGIETTTAPEAGAAAIEVQGPTNSLTVAATFKIRQVDGITVATAKKVSQIPLAPGPVIEPLPANPVVSGKLGILEKFVGTFQGTGLNMIFRPNTSGAGATDNILEYNLTSEKTTFLEDIGDVPNRGFAGQPDVILKAVPYTQQISDNLNPATGKADLPKPVPIHFEHGLFVRTPETQNPSVPSGTISRMASIPHGTTINAQGVEPSSTPVQGAPDIKSISMFPFTIGQPEQILDTFFPQTNFNPTQLRIPQDFAKFNTSGAITEAIFHNPNQVLVNANTNSTKKVIKDHITFDLTTVGTDALPGGGTANIAFLRGPNATPPQPNADGVSMDVKYWISTVVVDVIIPAGNYAAHPARKLLSSEATRVDKVPTPKFLVELKKNVSRDSTVKLEYTQLQYSQNVSLNFGPLTWPHISVATLQPQNPVQVKADSPLLANLK